MQKFLFLFLFLIGCSLPSIQTEKTISNFSNITIVSNGHKLVITVANDYFMRNDVRIPMGLEGAIVLAKRNNSILPTTKIVDEIYNHADLRLAPIPMPPGPNMSSKEYYYSHNVKIEKHIDLNFNGLIAGHKKDLVITNRLLKNPNRVAIYGWHRSNGVPIQQLSTVHAASYYDYSHGVRFIKNKAILDGKEILLTDLLNSNLSYIVSYEGKIDYQRIITAILN